MSFTCFHWYTLQLTQWGGTSSRHTSASPVPPSVCSILSSDHRTQITEQSYLETLFAQFPCVWVSQKAIITCAHHLLAAVFLSCKSLQIE